MAARLAWGCARMASRCVCAFAVAAFFAAQSGAAAQSQSQTALHQVDAVYSPWTKFCGREPQQGAKDTCLTVKEARDRDGKLILGAALIEQDGEARKILRITLPLGTPLPDGLGIGVDDTAPISGRYVVCLANGCMADFEVNAAFVTALKSGQYIVVHRTQSNAQPVPFTQPAGFLLPLSGFAAAHEGPPTDPKQFEVRQTEPGKPAKPTRNDELIRCGDEIGAAACAQKRLRETDK